MKQLASFARFTHITNILFSVSTAALCFQSALLLDWLFIPAWFYLLIFAYTFLFGSFISFAGNQVVNIAAEKTVIAHRKRWLNNLCASMAFAVTAVLSFKLRFLQFCWFLVPAILVCVYKLLRAAGLPANNKTQQKWLYIVFYSVVCTVTCTVLPASFIPFGFDLKFVFVLFFRLFFLLSIALAAYKINIPLYIIPIKTTGKNNYKKEINGITGAVLFLATLLLIPAFVAGVRPWYALGLMLSTAATWLFITYRIQNLTDISAALFPELCILLQTLLICIPILFS